MTANAKQEVGIALVGYGLMGRAHSYAYRVAPLLQELPCVPALKVLCGRHRDPLQRAAAAYGFREWSTDWLEAIQRPDVDLIDICIPPGAHLEVIRAAAEAGKAILCEKPLAASYEEAQLAADHATRSGVLNAVGFNYRRLPAVRLMKDLIDEGAIGEPRIWRAIWLSDEFADPAIPFDWRFDRAMGGSTAADIGIHTIDLARWMVGEIEEVVGESETFLRERPNPETGASVRVTTEDSCSALVRFAGGALGVLEMTKVVFGRPSDWTIEVDGTLGTLFFDHANLSELWFADARDATRTAGLRRIRAEGHNHPYAARWWPAGEGIGYDASFANQVCDLLMTWPTGPWSPDFTDAARTQGVVDGIERSCAGRAWVRVEGPEANRV